MRYVCRIPCVMPDVLSAAASLPSASVPAPAAAFFLARLAAFFDAAIGADAAPPAAQSAAWLAAVSETDMAERRRQAASQRRICPSRRSNMTRRDQSKLLTAAVTRVGNQTTASAT